MAFVDTNGVLIGSYEDIYDDIGNTVVDTLKNFINAQNVPNEKGKVW